MMHTVIGSQFGSRHHFVCFILSCSKVFIFQHHPYSSIYTTEFYYQHAWDFQEAVGQGIFIFWALDTKIMEDIEWNTDVC